MMLYSIVWGLVKINYLVIKNGDKYSITSKGEFKMLCMNGVINADTKLYDSDKAELVVVKEVNELFEIFNEIDVNDQGVNVQSEETLVQNPTNKKGIRLAENKDLEILFDEVEEDKEQRRVKNKSYNKSKNKRKKVFITILTLVVLGLIISSIMFVSNSRNRGSQEVATDIILQMSNDIEEGLEINGFSEQESTLGSHFVLVENTQELYNYIQEKVGGFEALISNEKIQEVLEYRIYKNMDDVKDFQEELLIYITELEDFVDDIEQSIEKYWEEVEILANEKRFDDRFIQSVKESVLKTQESVLDSYLKELEQMEVLNEVLDFMINNREKYLVVETGVNFLFDADQEHYYSLISKFYSLF